MPGDATISDNDVMKALNSWSKQQLYQLKSQLDEMFPASSLKGFNLEGELIDRYTATTQLWDTVLHDEAVPANQKAQVMNACANLLSQISKIQLEVYDSERVKRLEKVFIEVLNQLPNREQAVQLYEESARKYL